MESVRLQIIVTPEVAKFVAERAGDSHRSVSGWVRWLLEHELAKHEGKAALPAYLARTAAVPAQPRQSIVPDLPTLDDLRSRTASVQRPKRTALVSASDGRGGA